MNAASAPATITFHFSEAPTGFTAADIAAVGGTVSGLAQVSGDPTSYTASFTQTANVQGAGSVSVTNASYTDAAGNTGSGASVSFPEDNVAPSVAVSSDEASVNAASAPATITFHFSEAPTGFTAADIVAVGGTVSGLAQVSGDPTSYTASFTQTANVQGAGSVSVTNASYTDAAGNTGSGASVSFPEDNVAPSVTVTSNEASVNAASAPATITFHFSEAPTGFTAADIAAVGGTVSGLAQVSGDPTSYTASFTQTANVQGTGSVSVTNASYTDAAGNTGSGGSVSFPEDNVAPSVTVTSNEASVNAASAPATITFHFSEAPTGFTAADIAAVGGTVRGLAQVSGDPTSYTASFTQTALSRVPARSA